jgi:hypothetical protein
MNRLILRDQLRFSVLFRKEVKEIFLHINFLTLKILR